MDDVIDAGRSCRIPVADVEWRFQPSGGPGGQHANRAHSRVEARIDLETARGISDATRARLRRKLGDELRLVVDERRSQLRNRQVALERLESRLRAALVPEKKRRATKPSRAAKKRRVDAKKRRSQVKKGRRRPTADD